MTARTLALVTGASGGPELARCRAADGADLILAEAAIEVTDELGSPAAGSGGEQVRAAIAPGGH